MATEDKDSKKTPPHAATAASILLIRQALSDAHRTLDYRTSLNRWVTILSAQYR
jgi:hypothetical protein